VWFPTHEVEVVGAKMLPLISHKAAANPPHALNISPLRFAPLINS